MMKLMRTESVGVARLLLVSAMLSFSLGIFLIGKARSNSSTIFLVRGIGNIILIYSDAKIGGDQLFNRDKYDLILARSCLAIMSAFCTFTASKLLKISIYGILTRFEMILLFFIGIYFMGNRFDYRILVAAGISLFGVSLVLVPSIYGLGSNGSGEDLELTWTSQEILGILVVAAWMVFDSFGVVYTTIVMNSGVSLSQNLFLMNVTITLLGAILVIYSPTGIDLHFDDTFYYLAIILLFLGAQMMLSEGLRTEKNTGIFAVISSLFVIFCMIWDIFIDGTKVTLVNWAGAILVTASSVWAVVLREKK